MHSAHISRSALYCFRQRYKWKIRIHIHAHNQYDQETVLCYGSNIIAISRIPWSQACNSLVVIVCIPLIMSPNGMYKTVCTHIVNVWIAFAIHWPKDSWSEKLIIQSFSAPNRLCGALCLVDVVSSCQPLYDRRRRIVIWSNNRFRLDKVKSGPNVSVRKQSIV